MKQKTKDFVKKVVLDYPKIWEKGCCAFTVVDKNKGDFFLYPGGKWGQERGRTGDVCHAPLNGLKEEDPVIVVNAHRTTWQKTSKDFLLWCIRESPFARGVLNKDSNDEILNHAAALDTTEIGNGGALWVCKAVRHFTEDTYKIKTWEDLRAEGLDGLQALIGAEILDFEGNPNFSHTHVSLFNYDSPEELRKVYDEIKQGKKKLKTARGAGYGYGDKKPEEWGGLSSKLVKVSDGWGGFVELRKPSHAKEYVQKLKEIFEGDPKNVK